MSLLAAGAAVIVSLTTLAGCGGEHHRAQDVQAAEESGTEESLTTRYANFTVTDPKAAIQGLSDRRQKNAVGTPGAGSFKVANHIQGYVFYNRGSYGFFHIFSHSATNGGTAYIYITKGTTGGTKIATIPIPSGYRHPGGMQIIGDYLLVGMEGNSGSAAYMYNLTPVYKENKAPSSPVLLAHSSSVSGGASSVGITQVRGWMGTEGIRYIIATHQYGQGVDLYISSPGTSLAHASASNFTRFVYASLPGRQYDNMALLSTPSDEIWLAGFRGTPEKNADYVDLYKMSTSVSPPCNEHIAICIGDRFHGDSTPTLTKFLTTDNGPNFRWGVGLNIYENNRLRLNVSERNFVGKNVEVNWLFNY